MENHGNSSKLSEEIERDNDSSESEDDDKNGVGRTYECSFCKRGFTNAQALGGHMNIHRKDKAKAREKHHHAPPQPQPQPPPQPTITHHHHHDGHHPAAGQRNYGYYPFAAPRLFGMQGMIRDHHDHGHVATDLSLSIDHYQGRQDKDSNKRVDYNDIDLELRLGYHP